MKRRGWLLGVVGLGVGFALVVTAAAIVLIQMGRGSPTRYLRGRPADSALGGGSGLAYTYLSLNILRPSRVGVLDDACGARWLSGGMMPSDHTPVWSPDGTRLAYTSMSVTGRRPPRLTVVNEDGSSPTEVEPDGSAKLQVKWSPSGRSLAYLSTRPGVAADGSPTPLLTIVNLDGGEVRRIPAEPVVDYVWAGDGLSLIAIVRDAAVVWLRRYLPDGSASPPVALPEQLGRAPYVVLSPDGTRVAYTDTAADSEGDATREGLYIVDAEGGTPRHLSALWVVTTPVWSPDGRHVAFAAYDDGAFDALYVAAADGTALRRLVTLNEGDESGEVLPGAPAWSPDGSRIAYGSMSAGAGSAIYVVDLADGSVRQVTDLTTGLYYDLAWRPDGAVPTVCP